MKKFYRPTIQIGLFILVFLYPKLLLAQECDEAIGFYSQLEVDSFDRFDCASFDGLYIGGYEDGNDITNLNALSALTASVGNLVVAQNPLLENLDGLSGISEIQELLISSNDSLQNFDGLASASKLGLVWIIDNPSLTSMSGLGDTANLNYLLVAGNNTLENLDGLETLETAYYVTVIDNESLVDVQGLSGLKEVDYFSVERNESLISFGGLESLQAFELLRISVNPNLESIEGFDSLTGSVGNIVLYGNSRLRSLSGLSSITGVTGLTISDTSLPNLQGFSNLQVSSSTIRIQDNTMLKSLEGLDNLATVGGALGISGNASLNDISALSNVTSVDGINYNGGIGLVIADNPSLIDCSSVAPLLGVPEATDLQSALIYGSVGYAIDIGAEGELGKFESIGLPNGEGANSVQDCIDAYEPLSTSDLVNKLAMRVLEINAASGISNALDSKLNSTLRAMDDSNENNDGAVINAMYAFCNNVHAQSGKKLSPDDAESLILEANIVIHSIDEFASPCG